MMSRSSGLGPQRRPPCSLPSCACAHALPWQALSSTLSLSHMQNRYASHDMLRLAAPHLHMFEGSEQLLRRQRCPDSQGRVQEHRLICDIGWGTLVQPRLPDHLQAQAPYTITGNACGHVGGSGQRIAGLQCLPGCHATAATSQLPGYLPPGHPAAMQGPMCLSMPMCGEAVSHGSAGALAATAGLTRLAPTARATSCCSPPDPWLSCVDPARQLMDDRLKCLATDRKLSASGVYSLRHLAIATVVYLATELNVTSHLADCISAFEVGRWAAMPMGVLARGGAVYGSIKTSPAFF